MQAHHSYQAPPPDFIEARESYFTILREIRSLNTFENQKLSAAEYATYLVREQKKEQWIREEIQSIQKQREERAELLKEMGKYYEALLKFALDNPLIMSTGMAPKEWEIIIDKQKKCLNAVNDRIKELEKIIMLLKIEYDKLTQEIIVLENKIKEIDQRCLKAALELYVLPEEDKHKFEKCDLSKIEGIQDYLPTDKSKHVVEVKHVDIITEYQEQLRKNPEDITVSKVAQCKSDAIKIGVKNAVHNHFLEHSPQLSPEKLHAAVNLVINSPESSSFQQELEHHLIRYINKESTEALLKGDKEKQKEKVRLSHAREQRNKVSKEIQKNEDQLKMEEATKANLAAQLKTTEHYTAQHDSVVAAASPPLEKPTSSPEIASPSAISDKPLEVNEPVLSTPLKPASNEPSFSGESDPANQDEKKINPEIPAVIEKPKPESASEDQKPELPNTEQTASNESSFSGDPGSSNQNEKRINPEIASVLEESKSETVNENQKPELPNTEKPASNESSSPSKPSLTNQDEKKINPETPPITEKPKSETVSEDKKPELPKTEETLQKAEQVTSVTKGIHNALQVGFTREHTVRKRRAKKSDSIADDIVELDESKVEKTNPTSTKGKEETPSLNKSDQAHKTTSPDVKTEETNKKDLDNTADVETHTPKLR